MTFVRSRRIALLAGLVMALPMAARAQLIVSDTLDGTVASTYWTAFNGACLTAGPAGSTIPACGTSYGGVTHVGGYNGSLPDPVGKGALRLTNGGNATQQTGSVVSKTSFPSNQGLQVTFKTVTYGGNNYAVGSSHPGADGISFFLIDASNAATVPTAGGSGGSLGYSCSNGNPNYDGTVGGYLGVGIDEFGNFSNRGDNTASGPGQQPGRIVMRGAGTVAWSWLHANKPTYYPTVLPAGVTIASAVTATCSSGYLYNYSGATITDANGIRISNKGQTTEPVADYPFMVNSTLPTGVSISNQQITSSSVVPKRPLATPLTYALNITQDGKLSVSVAVNGGTAQPILSNQSIATTSAPLPSNFLFGFSAGTGGGTNVHEIMCFKVAASNQSSSSAGINLQQSAQVQVGSQVYFAFYSPTNWAGKMTAQNLVFNAASGSTPESVTISSVANWDASCVLTGGACAATNVTSTTNAAQAPSSRAMLTWNGSSGIPFEWDNLTAAQKTALTAGDSSITSDRLDYLRGDRSDELTTSGGGKYRLRTSVLGDIISSSPTWIGAPALSYDGAWSDLLFPSAAMTEGSTSYKAYMNGKATRQNVVYVGSNDGWLHGFRAGAYDASGNFVANSTTPNDGLEVLAYMPAAVLNTIHSTVQTVTTTTTTTTTSTGAFDYSSPLYSHNYYVDATPGSGDLYYGGAWHTWLVGGLGAGGNASGPINDNTTVGTGAIYALDVTDPTTFSEANASSLVKGEWSSATISCTNSAICAASMGSSFGTPIIRRLHNGQWALIFGNGLNSSSGVAGIYIASIDGSTGAITPGSTRFLSTGTGTSSAKSGIVGVTSADLDGDHVTDYVYAGDVTGKVWRFDLTSATASNWAAGSSPIFSASGKPITTAVTVISAPTAGGSPRILVEFGTGQQLPQTQTSAMTYATAQQSLYGIWDWNMASWNAKSTTKYASLGSLPTGSTLTSQTITTVAATATVPSYRTVTQNVVCWAGLTICGSGNTAYGWQVDLPSSSNEQVIYSPTINSGIFIVNTTVPVAATQTLSCDVQTASGYTMALSAQTGGAPIKSFFADPNGNFATVTGVVGGIGLSATGSPAIVTANKKPYLVQQTTNGTGNVTQVNPAAAGIGSRLTWLNLR